MKTYQFLWRMICYRPWLYTANAILWSVVTLTALAPGLLNKWFFDWLSGNAPAAINLWTILALVALVAFMRMSIVFAGILVDTQHRFSMSALLRRNLMARIFQRPGANAIPGATGEALNTLREDAEVVEDTISWLVDQLSIVVQATVALVIMFAIDAQITLVTLLPLIIIVALARVAATHIERYRAASRNASERVSGAMVELFSAVQSIQLAVAERHVLHHFRGLNEQRQQVMVRDRLLNQILDSIFWNTSTIGIGIILLLVAAKMRNQANPSDSFSVGDFALFVSYLDLLTTYLTFFGTFLNHYRQTGVSLTRLVQLMQGAPPAQLVEHQPLHLRRRSAGNQHVNPDTS